MWSITYSYDKGIFGIGIKRLNYARTMQNSSGVYENPSSGTDFQLLDPNGIIAEADEAAVPQVCSQCVAN